MVAINLNVIGAPQAATQFNLVAAGVTSLADALQAANRSNLSTLIPSLDKASAAAERLQGAGTNVKVLSSSLDTYNQVLKTTSQITVQLTDANGNLRDVVIGTATAYKNFAPITEQLEKLAVVQEKVALSNKNMAQSVASAQEAYSSLPIVAQTEALIANAEARIRIADNAIANGRGVLGRAANGRFISVPAEPYKAAAEQDIQTAQATLAADQQAVTLNAQLNSEKAAQVELNRQNLALLQDANRAISNAALANTPFSEKNLPRNIQTIASESPATFAALQQQGLGKTPQQIVEQTNNGQSIQVMRDLQHQITTTTGTIVNQDGSVSHLRASYDAAGKSVTQYGAQLSGMSNYLKQTINDFIKLTQWMAATAILFASFRVVGAALGQISAFDKQLKQLSITSQSSNADVKSLFQGLSDIAYRTATPLEEILKSADDIALATRKANQTTQEWKQSFLELTEAVGILTNISGLDTVKASDLLTSTMKQLGIGANDLLGILNKVTAVAGGQSNAVADIVTGLGSMAQAAREAGLSVDQTIATIQVLSQVTSKSSSEVAVSFKNLTGSLGSPGALKIFEKYNIAVKDAQGNLRNILEIYGEINDKIKSGIIASGDVQSVLRGISGGPRRLPDAAALLANIGTIGAVTEKSVGATNEALIANAKILDTIPAKITQVTVAFQSFIQSKFGEAFKDVVNGLLSLGKNIVNFLSLIPTGFYTAGLQLAAVFLAVKLGITAVAALTGKILQLNESLFATKAAGAAATFGIQQTMFAANTGAGTGAAGIGKKALFGISGAAIGAGAAAASGANLQTIAGSGLQGLGLGLLSVPSPDPYTKIGGALALIIGTVLPGALDALTGSEKVATQSEIDLNTELLNSVTAYKDQLSSVKELQTAHGDLEKTIQRLLSTTNRSISDDKALAAAQQDFAENTLDLTKANDLLSESFKKVAASAGISGYQLRLLSSGQLSPEDIKVLTDKATKVLFNSVNQGYTGTQNFDFKIPSPGVPNVSAIDQFLSQYPDNQNPESGFNLKAELARLLSKGPQFLPATGNTSAILSGGNAFDLTSLRSNAGEVTKLFDETGSRIEASIEPTVQNFALIDTAIGQLSTDLQAKYGPAFAAYRDNIDAFSGSLDQIDKNIARINAEEQIGIITQDQASAAKGYEQLLQRIFIDSEKLQGTRGIAGIPVAPTIQQKTDFTSQLQTELSSSVQVDQNGVPTAPVPKNTAIDIATKLFQSEGTLPTLQKNGALLDATITLFTRAGIAINGLTQAEMDNAKASDALATAQEDLDKGFNSVTQTLLQKRADLQAQSLTGADTRGAQEQNQALLDGEQQLQVVFGEKAKSLNEIRSSLSGVVGLEDLAISSNGELLVSDSQLGSAIVKNIERYGLVGAQIRKYIDLIIQQTNVSQELESAQGKLSSVDLSAADRQRYSAQVDALKKQRDDINAQIDALQRGGHPGIYDKPITVQATVDTNTMQNDILKAFDQVKASIETKKIQLQFDIQNGKTIDFGGQLAGQLNAQGAGSDAFKAALGGVGGPAMDQLMNDLTKLPLFAEASTASYDAFFKDVSETPAKLGLNAESTREFFQFVIARAKAAQDEINANQQKQSNKLYGTNNQNTDIISTPIGNFLQKSMPDVQNSTVDWNQVLENSLTTWRGINNEVEKQKAFVDSLTSSYQGQAGSLLSERAKLEADITGQLVTLSKADPSDTKQINSIKAAIAADRERIGVLNVEVKANNTLFNSFKTLREEELTKYAAALSTIHGFESLAFVDNQNLAQTIISLIDTFGIATSKVGTFITALLAYANALTNINNMETVIKIRTQHFDEYYKKGEDPYLPGQVGPPRPGAAATTTPQDTSVIDYWKKQTESLQNQLNAILKSGTGSYKPPVTEPASTTGPTGSTGNIDVGKLSNAQIAQAVTNARNLQGSIPGETKDAAKDLVALLRGTTNIENIRGIKEEYLRIAIEELTKATKENTVATLDVSTLDIPKQIINGGGNISRILGQAVANARSLQALIPNANKDASNDVVELLNGTKRVLEVRGVKEEYLRQALQELADVEQKRLDFETKADTIRRIRVGAGDFAAFANVPLNSQTGVSVGGPQGSITLSVNFSGNLSPAQQEALSRQIAAALARQLANG